MRVVDMGYAKLIWCWMRSMREDEEVLGLRANLYLLAVVVICLARSS